MSAFLWVEMSHETDIPFSVCIHPCKWKCLNQTGKIKYDLRFSRQWLWRMPSSGMWRHVTLVRTDVSEECLTSIIRMTIICDLGTMSDWPSVAKWLWLSHRLLSLKWESNIWLRVLRDSDHWGMCTAKYRPIPSSERAPYMKKEVHVRLKNLENLVMGPNGWPDTKTY
jgi:hypothetical protein